jgi:hypothetical protein
MKEDFISGLVAIALAIVSVATLAVIFSPNAKTSQVLTSAGNAFSNMLGAAVAPVSGGSMGIRPMNNFGSGY